MHHLAHYIASRIYRGQEGGKRLASRPAVLIAMAGITIGMAVMLVAVYTGWLDRGLSAVYDFVLSGAGNAMMSLLRAVGLF